MSFDPLPPDPVPPAFDVDVTRRVGGRDIACRFHSGAGLTVLFGRSGAGKTSVLNMVAGLMRPDAGHVRVAGVTLFGHGTDVPAERRRAGYVFQDPRLFPHMRVAANLRYGVRPGGGGMGEAEVIAFLGLSGLLDRWPATLSGGEARRVAIGRALLSDPAFLLMDEPLSSLDGARREEIMAVIERLRDAAGLPILYVTHDPAEAERLATCRVDMG